MFDPHSSLPLQIRTHFLVRFAARPILVHPLAQKAHHVGTEKLFMPSCSSCGYNRRSCGVADTRSIAHSL